MSAVEKQDYIPDFACNSCFARIENWFNGSKILKLFKATIQSKDKNDDNDKKENEEEDDNESDDLNYEPENDDVPTLFDGELLENFFKDVTGVSLTKEGYEIAVSRLKEMKLVSKALKGTAARSREQQYSHFAHIDKIIPPPLHIRIGIMYAFITAILGPSKRQCPAMVTYLMAKFSKTEAKVKAGTFDGKQFFRTKRKESLEKF
ncbi:hypothetical protein TYRP_016548, partial [Tyrophagus putrescentiae]